MAIHRRLRAIGGLAAAALAFPAGGAAAQSISYRYDELGRVTMVSYPNGVSVSYVYDAAGNRTQVSSGATPPPPPPPPPPPLSAAVDATTYTRTASSIPPAVLCSGSGGTAPYSFTWQYVSGDTLTEVVDPSSNAGEWFRPVAMTTFQNSTWRCRVTDAASATANSANVAVAIRTN